MVIFSDRKRCGTRQKVVTAELKSRGTMNRTGVASKTGSRLTELTNQRRGPGPKIWVYSDIPHGGAKWLRLYLPLSFRLPFFLFCWADLWFTSAMILYVYIPLKIVFCSFRARIDYHHPVDSGTLHCCSSKGSRRPISLIRTHTQ